MKSKTLANILNRWYRISHHHNFISHNIGISAAICNKCGLTITIRGKIMDVDEQFFWLSYDDSSKHGYPAPHQLKRMANSYIPICEIIQALEVMDS